MNYIQILLDALVGAILLGVFSYLSQLYVDKPYYIRIIAFIWATPTLYFYFLYIASRNSKKAMYDFTNHGILGLLITLFAMFMTYLMASFKKNTIIIANLTFLILVFIWYFCSKIYSLF